MVRRRASAVSGRCLASPVRDRLLVRSAGHDATTRWPIGAQVGISIGDDAAVALATA
jgi:hypothetical protein